MSLKRVCAWCQADMGEVSCPATGVTHCICPSCFAMVETELFLHLKHSNAGFALERDENIIVLKKGDNTIASFSLPVNRETIIREAEKYLHSPR